MTPDSIVLYGDAAPPEASAIRTAAFDEARARLHEASALVVVLPTPRWITLVLEAQRQRPPLQVLVLSPHPRETRGSLHAAGTRAEVLRAPVEWDEVLRRLGFDQSRRQPA